MDGLVVGTGAAAGLAIAVAVLALQSSSAAAQRVRSRTLTYETVSSEPATEQIVVPRLKLLSDRGRQLTLDLERAGLAFTLTEYLSLRAAAGVIGALAAVVIGSSLFDLPTPFIVLASLIGFFVGYWLPTRYVERRKANRLKLVEDQLLDALTSMAKSLRAGVGLIQALEYVSRDAEEPLSSELHRIVRELRLGADIEVVLEEMNARIGSPELEITSTAIIIQRRVGGNLSEILTNVANTIRERQTIRNDLHAVTAEARLQGNLSALVPVLLAMFFLAVNNETARLIFETTLGNIALATGIFFELAGLWMIRKFSQIEV